nr:MAG TPA: hypothetical protein [Crassvirales sp.]
MFSKYRIFVSQAVECSPLQSFCYSLHSSSLL